MNKILLLLLKFKQPSTWASIAAITGLVGYQIPDATVQSIMQGITLIAGIIGIWMDEGKAVTKVDGF